MIIPIYLDHSHTPSGSEAHCVGYCEDFSLFGQTLAMFLCDTSGSYVFEKPKSVFFTAFCASFRPTYTPEKPKSEQRQWKVPTPAGELLYACAQGGDPGKGGGWSIVVMGGESYFKPNIKNDNFYTQNT